MALVRGLPQAIESEKGLLGSMIIGGHVVVGEIYNIITAQEDEWFIEDRHATIYGALIEQWREGTTIDLVTFTQFLRNAEKLTVVGGAEYITSLFTFVPSAVNWPAYLEELSDKRWLRIAAEVGKDIRNRAIDNQDDVEGTLQTIEHDLMRLTQRHASFLNQKTISDLSSTVISDLEDPEKSLGISTGFPSLDEVVGGLAETSKIVIAGKTSSGKSALAANIARSVAVVRAYPTAVFTFEMSAKHWVQRVIQIHAGISARKVIGKNVDMFDVQKFSVAASEVSRSKLTVINQRLDIAGIRARCMQLKPRVVIIDYLQIVPDQRQRGENRTDQLDRMSSQSKQLAHEMELTLIELSQLTYDDRAGTYKTKSSSAITNDADQLWVLEGDDDEEKDIIDKDIAVAKQREGGRKKVHFKFNKPCTKFTERPK